MEFRGRKLQRILGIEVVSEEKVGVFWDIDVEEQTVTNQWGLSIPLQPFLGCVGVASRDDERVPGWVPHSRCGGNLDCKMLTAGSCLFLPVEVEGAPLSVGDAHAAQGDRGLSGTGIECSMEAACVQVLCHPNMSIDFPRALRRGQWVTFGFGKSLDEAAAMAANRSLGLMTEK